MRFIDELPQNDQKALRYHIECVKKEVKNDEIDICVYEDPTLYIIYIDDENFNTIESKINGILENGLKKYPKISKLILCSPKSFMVSYEEKIELESSSIIKTNDCRFGISEINSEEAKYKDQNVKVDNKIKPELQNLKPNDCRFEISEINSEEAKYKDQNVQQVDNKIKPELQEENFYNYKSVDYDLNKEYIKKRGKYERSAA